MFKLLSRIRSNSKRKDGIDFKLTDTITSDHPTFETTDEQQDSGYTMMSFDEVLKNERTLSQKDLHRFAELYTEDILSKYKTIFTKSGPIFSHDTLCERLIDAIPDKVIQKIKPFHAIGFHRKERPTISFANHCEYRLMDALVLNYSPEFICYVIHRLPDFVQYVLLTVYCDYVKCPKTIDFTSLDLKYHLKHKNDKNPAFVELLQITGGYKPIIIKATVTEDVEYNHAIFV